MEHVPAELCFQSMAELAAFEEECEVLYGGDELPHAVMAKKVVAVYHLQDRHKPGAGLGDLLERMHNKLVRYYAGGHRSWQPEEVDPADWVGTIQRVFTPEELLRYGF